MKENNKLIAEFMGKEIYQHYHESNYHSSWNWLMPVVDKIEDMGCEVVITNGECTISGNDYYVEIIGKNRRGATYDAVVEFINQYNKNK
ncbi:MAG: hypothetical protein GY861_06755 [bacterium]|nr:hypothetical protein [bacterium]